MLLTKEHLPQVSCGNAAYILRTNVVVAREGRIFPQSRKHALHLPLRTLIISHSHYKLFRTWRVAHGDSMAASPLSAHDRSHALKIALRLIRRKRALRTRDIAAAMGLPLRSYEHFEAGGGQTNIARIFDFADATNSDPFAIIWAVELGIPEFAVRCADNKLCQVMAYALQDLDADLGDGIAELEVSALITTFTSVMTLLADEARDRQVKTAAWLARRAGGDGDDER